MVRVGICDDETVLLEKLNQFVQACYAGNQIFARVDTFANGQQLLYEIEDGGRFDLVLLDIEMPQMDGMELAGRIRKVLPEVLVIFITSPTAPAAGIADLPLSPHICRFQNSSSRVFKPCILDWLTASRVPSFMTQQPSCMPIIQDRLTIHPLSMNINSFSSSPS